MVCNIKDVFASYPSGVSIVSTKLRGNLYGFTASSIVSVSLVPELVSFCVNIRNKSYQALVESEQFAISILCNNQVDIAQLFATSNSNKFQQID